MSNSDVDEVKINSPDSFFDIFGKLQNLDFKQSIFIFLLFIFVSSDLFYEHFLSMFDGAVDMRNVTNYGVIIQGVMLTIGFIVFNSMVKAELI
ncbi:hypothetical protein F-liban_283 [Faustovirus]|nr:hypothetical protein PRJ_Fausto_00292 [Faustovirus]QBR99200.1 hypothetical protein [Faustovirus mariensis]QJX71031.1 hypothetical protein F-liban_283 [Faustovirus]SME64961.1 Hypothetical protein FSTVST1_274 [Faustovirus ST1]